MNNFSVSERNTGQGILPRQFYLQKIHQNPNQASNTAEPAWLWLSSLVTALVPLVGTQSHSLTQFASGCECDNSGKMFLSGCLFLTHMKKHIFANFFRINLVLHMKLFLCHGLLCIGQILMQIAFPKDVIWFQWRLQGSLVSCMQKFLFYKVLPSNHLEA